MHTATNRSLNAENYIVFHCAYHFRIMFRKLSVEKEKKRWRHYRSEIIFKLILLFGYLLTFRGTL